MQQKLDDDSIQMAGLARERSFYEPLQFYGFLYWEINVSVHFKTNTLYALKWEKYTYKMYCCRFTSSESSWTDLNLTGNTWRE